MDRAKTIIRLAYQIIMALGALACVLVWLGIKPKDFTAMTISGPHWLWLLAAFALFTASLVSSKYNWASQRSNKEQGNQIKRLTTEIECMKADYEKMKLALHWPHLKCGEVLKGFGMYQVLENILGAGFGVLNDELRYASTTHNVHATIRFHHVSSNTEIVADSGVWYWYDGQHHFADKVSLNMGERRELLIFFWNANTVPRDFRAVNGNPPVYSSASKLKYGEWRIIVGLIGDNFIGEHKTTVTLTPSGGIPGCS